VSPLPKVTPPSAQSAFAADFSVILVAAAPGKLSEKKFPVPYLLFPCSESCRKWSGHLEIASGYGLINTDIIDIMISE
jgi:hypothetical protein